MGQITQFIPKLSGEKFFASEYMQFVKAINDIERAINLTSGTSNAQIPSSNLAGKIPGSKIDPESTLSISGLSVAGPISLSGSIDLGTSGSIVIKNGLNNAITIGPHSLIASDGARTTFLIANDGKVSLKGHIESDDTSVLRGIAYIKSGNVYDLLTIGGDTGISLSGSNKEISIGANGKLRAGDTYLDSTGLHMLSGNIAIRDGAGTTAFSVSSAGELFANNATISGLINATSGTLGGISISPTGISTSKFSILSSGKIVASDVDLTGVINATSGTLGNLTINGVISGQGYRLSNSGIEITKGSIDLGNGSFTVDSLGKLSATNVNISGHINAVTGNISGTLTAGSVILSNEGIHVAGSKGIIIDSGSIEVWTDDSIPEKVLTLGKYVDNTEPNYGILVQDSSGKTFSVNSSGNVFVKGILEGESGSQIIGHIVAETGEFYSVNIKGNLSVLPGGSIAAGSSVISDRGIALNSGSISIGNNFSVDESGYLTAVNANIKGAIEATSGKISGSLFLGNSSLVLDGNRGVIEAGGTVLSGSGITLRSGSINLGAGNFSVDDSGTLIAQRATIKGHLHIQGANVLGTIDAGNVLIYQQGIIVKGEEGIKVSSGSIQILDHDHEKEIITIGSFYDKDDDGSTIQEYGLRVKDENEDTFKIRRDGRVYVKGVLHGTDGVFSGEIHANRGTFADVDVTGEIRVGSLGSITVIEGGKVTAGGSSIGSDGIHLSSGSTADFGNLLTISPDGVLTATGVNLAGKITANSGSIGGIEIASNKIFANYNPDEDKFINDKGFCIDSNGLIRATGVDITGKIEATSGYIGGIKILDSSIEAGSGTFKLTKDGLLEAKNVILEGDIIAHRGSFGDGSGTLKAGSASFVQLNGSISTVSGIWTGSSVGASDSSFWISSSEFIIVDENGKEIDVIYPGDAYFKGSISVDSSSIIDGGDLVIKSGSIIAGDERGAHARISLFTEDNPGSLDGQSYLGPLFYASDEEGKRLFSISKAGAYIKGEINADRGRIGGKLAIGSGGNIYLDGESGSEGIYLFASGDGTNRVVRLDSLGLYISNDGGSTYSPALTGSGVTANAINDGFLTISDYRGSGASGIVVKKWNITKNTFDDKVVITPDGISVLDGSITVYSDVTGEVLIGGGYLRVGGLDYGVVTSNNYVANGNFAIVSEDYGIRKKNKGEVFLGQAHSSGGAVSNPTYHYVGWPDHGERGRHETWTYKVQPDGIVPDWDPDDPNDPNRPVMTRTTFNPQWSVVHPTLEYCVVPNDACNWIVILDKEGYHYTELLSWKGGLYGAAFTPDGNRLVVAGDDIDRKRGPWDVSVFDTSDPDPKNWHMLGYILVGEFPCKVVCDDKGFAYVTVSSDNTVYKININELRVDKILTFSGPTVPQPIAISQDYGTIYVGGVVSDYIHVIPTHFNTPADQCEKWTVLPYPQNRGIVHDICLSPDGRYIFSVNASITDGNVVMIDTRTGEIVDWIDGSMKDRLDVPEGASQEEIDRYNFLSATTLVHHPTLPLIYITVTNRCATSILTYGLDPETGDLIEPMHELNRFEGGSNVSGISISKDGTRLYVQNHHYHTYPLGSNRVWSYDGDRNFYDQNNPELYDTTQYFYHHNPAGMVLTNNDTRLWVANRATHKIDIIDVTDRNAWANMESITNVGQNPYAMKATPSRDKIILTNDDSYDQIDPDFISVIDVATKSLEAKIHVGDRPIGLEILEVNPDERYVFVACHDGNLIQKVSLEQRKVIESIYLDGKPRHLKIVNDKLFATGFENNKLYVIAINADDGTKMELITSVDTKKDPTQLALVGEFLYVVCQGSDCVQVFDINTYNLVTEIKVGSMPRPIGYNKVKNKIYIGNAGEGSCCIIDPVTNTVSAWVMTGFSSEYITVSNSGEKWYVACHGPKDIISYGEGTPYTGDAYLDSDGKSHKYGASYWMPSRSEWHRAEDSTLTGFASVEFWPQGVLQDKRGYAHLTVMGVYDAFAQIEQDVYALTNNSDGASDIKVQTIELIDYNPLRLDEDIADYTSQGTAGYDPNKAVLICDAKNPSRIYVEGAAYQVNYDLSTITKRGTAIPDRASSNYKLIGTFPVSLNNENFSMNVKEYNTVDVHPLNERVKTYIEDVDYVIDYNENTIARKDTISQTVILTNGVPVEMISKGNLYSIVEVWNEAMSKRYTNGADFTIDKDSNTLQKTTSSAILSGDTVNIIYKSSIQDGETVTVNFRHLLLARYYYHPRNRNYTDLTLSADFYWRWPRPENQTVTMHIDELVPKFVIVDNEQITPFKPVADNVFEEYKGLTYSSYSNRTESAIFSSSAKEVSGSIHSLADGKSFAELPAGEQYIEVDMGASYYINEIEVIQSKTGKNWNGVKVLAWDGKSYDAEHMPLWKEIYSPSTIKDSYSINFKYTHTDKNGMPHEYYGPKIIRSLRIYSNDSASNRWEQIKIMGDWKIVTSYRFASNTLWDSEGTREEYLTLQDETPVRFDLPQGSTNGSAPVRYRTYYEEMDGTKIFSRGFVEVWSLFGDQKYEENVDYIVDRIANKIQRVSSGKINSGDKVRIVYKFIQENLSNTTIPMAPRNPNTGEFYGPGSVAETDVTGAWAEWEFENEYRADWYVGWVSDIGMGEVGIFIDDEMVHKVSQMASRTERFSQVANDLIPGKHRIRVVQQQGKINFDRIKLEDFQLYHTENSVIASPSTNPVELFEWYTAKAMPGKARKYLGRGAQVISGAYDAPRVDTVTRLPNRQVPLKYRIRFKTELTNRGTPEENPNLGSGGELGDREAKFERGSVLITAINFEEGINPTYWRANPGTDMYPGFMVEAWNPSKPRDTGIQRWHLANGSVTSEKLKSFSVKDIHIDNNANIQESKLLLNHPTHPHENKNILDSISGWGSSGLSTVLSRDDHTHDELVNKEISSWKVTGDVEVGGRLMRLGYYELVHSRPLFGVAGDLEFQTDNTSWTEVTKTLNPFSYAMPPVKNGAKRYYKLYMIFVDNIGEDEASVYVRLKGFTNSKVFASFDLGKTGSNTEWHRDWLSPSFEVVEGDHIILETMIQNSHGTYTNPGDRVLEIHYAELKAYDVYEL